MVKEDEFDFFMEELLSRAQSGFKQTARYDYLREKWSQMDETCENYFNREDLSFVTECFEQIMEIDGEEARYVYRQGLLDCITLLKRLRVLI